MHPHYYRLFAILFVVVVNLRMFAGRRTRREPVQERVPGQRTLRPPGGGPAGAVCRHNAASCAGLSHSLQMALGQIITQDNNSLAEPVSSFPGEGEDHCRLRLTEVCKPQAEP